MAVLSSISNDIGYKFITIRFIKDKQILRLQEITMISISLNGEIFVFIDGQTIIKDPQL